MVRPNSSGRKSSAQMVARSSKGAHSKALVIPQNKKLPDFESVNPPGSYGRRKLPVNPAKAPKGKGPLRTATARENRCRRVFGHAEHDGSVSFAQGGPQRKLPEVGVTFHQVVRSGPDKDHSTCLSEANRLAVTVRCLPEVNRKLTGSRLNNTIFRGKCAFLMWWGVNTSKRAETSGKCFVSRSTCERKMTLDAVGKQVWKRNETRIATQLWCNASLRKARN